MNPESIPDYHVFLPIALHQQAEDYIDYLRALPDRHPTTCHRCGHRHLVQIHDPSLRLPFFRCSICRAGCNSLTGTPFSRFSHMELWPDFGACLLAGWTVARTGAALGIAMATAHTWARPARAVMADDFPELYRWWSARQDRRNLKAAPHIEVQRQAICLWLNQLLASQQAACPHCHSTNTARSSRTRPNFRCRYCERNFTLLTDTPLLRLTHIELWQPFLQGLMNGESVGDLQRKTGLGGSTCRLWHKRFLQLIEAQGHAELAQWIRWQRGRRVWEIAVFNRAGGRLEKAGHSRYSSPLQKKAGRYPAKS